MRRFTSCATAHLVVVAASFGIMIAVEALPGAEPGTEKAIAESASLAKVEAYLYVYRIALAQREWLANHVARAEEILDECPTRVRGWEWHYLKRLCHTELVCFRGQPEGSWAMAFSPDGKLVASAGREVMVWEPRTGKLRVSFPGAATSVAFSPDGKHVCSAGAGTVKVWEAATGEELLSIPAHERLITSVAFSPDGRRLASGSEDQTIKIWDVATGLETLTLSGHKATVTGVTFNPDGHQLASSSADSTVRLWDARSELVVSPTGAETNVSAEPPGH